MYKANLGSLPLIHPPYSDQLSDANHPLTQRLLNVVTPSGYPHLSLSLLEIQSTAAPGKLSKTYFPYQFGLLPPPLRPKFPVFFNLVFSLLISHIPPGFFTHTHTKRKKFLMYPFEHEFQLFNISFWCNSKISHFLIPFPALFLSRYCFWCNYCSISFPI